MLLVFTAFNAVKSGHFQIFYHSTMCGNHLIRPTRPLQAQGPNINDCIYECRCIFPSNTTLSVDQQPVHHVLNLPQKIMVDLVVTLFLPYVGVLAQEWYFYLKTWVKQRCRPGSTTLTRTSPRVLSKAHPITHVWVTNVKPNQLNQDIPYEQ